MLFLRILLVFVFVLSLMRVSGSYARTNLKDFNCIGISSKSIKQNFNLKSFDKNFFISSIINNNDLMITYDGNIQWKKNNETFILDSYGNIKSNLWISKSCKYLNDNSYVNLSSFYTQLKDLINVVSINEKNLIDLSKYQTSFSDAELNKTFSSLHPTAKVHSDTLCIRIKKNPNKFLLEIAEIKRRGVRCTKEGEATGVPNSNLNKISKVEDYASTWNDNYLCIVAIDNNGQWRNDEFGRHFVSEAKRRQLNCKSKIIKNNNKTVTASNQIKIPNNRPLKSVSVSTVCFNATTTSNGKKVWNDRNVNFVGEANYRGLDCGVTNDNKAVVISSPKTKTSTTDVELEKAKREAEELRKKLAALEKKQRELQFKSKTVVEKKPKIEKNWCLPQNEFQRNIPFHKFEDGVDCPENTLKITKQRALNIFLIKYNGYLDNIIKSNSICDDTFKNYKYLRELIKEDKNFKCNEEFQIVKKNSNEKDLQIKPQSEFPLKPIFINFPYVSVKRDDIAVIIGNANYKKQGKDIPNVNPAYADAEGIKQYFMKAKGVREGNIIYLKDATGAQLLSVFGNDKSHKGKLFNYIKPYKSNVYIYYAGHGAPGKEGDAYLVPTDTDSQTIEFTGYPLSTLYSNLGKLPAKSMIVILEACFSGSSQSGSLISRASPIVIQPKKTFIPNNIKVIAAGSEKQMASWEEDSSHSLFTKYFLKAMSGEGDNNKDGKVSDDELKEYLSDTMTYYARRYYGRDQKVQIHNGG